MHSLGGVKEELKEQLMANFRTAEISELDKIILNYVEKLTLRPGEVTKADVEILFEAGLDKQGVHDIVQVVSYFSYVNRMADGLGIELEAE